MWPEDVKEMYRYRDMLSSAAGVLMYGDRVVVPRALRGEVLATLHAGHQGVTSMLARGMSSVWWPGMKEDVLGVRRACGECDSNAPSQSREPPPELSQPEYPFQRICADYFAVAGKQYLVLVDRYSGWPSIHQPKVGGTAREFVNILKAHCETFGIPEELATDGGSQFVAGQTIEFMKVWGIEHRLSSAYNPHSNTRAELGVKSMKRLVRSNLGPGGSLDTVKMSRALMEYRNTPDRDTGLSPAQVIFGRQMRDFIPVKKDAYKPRKEWVLDAERRELALAKRHLLKKEVLMATTKELLPLALGQDVSVQNQTGPDKLKWDKSGVVVAALPHHQYKIKMDGTGRVSLRNRVFLRAILPYGAGGHRQELFLPARGPPGPLGVVNPQASPPVVLGGPTRGPHEVPPPRRPDDVQQREELVCMPREVEEEDCEELELRKGTRVRRKPDVYVPGTWGLMSGRSGGPLGDNGVRDQSPKGPGVGPPQWTRIKDAEDYYVFPAKRLCNACEQD
jgi:hypothetical protein